jgi:hypothetical protein
MGNRAVITLDHKPTINSLGIYLHWNGGPESVLAFAQAAHDLGALERYGTDNEYAFARLVQVITNFFGGTISVGVNTIGNLDHDNRDNGLFVMGVNNGGHVFLHRYPRGRSSKSIYVVGVEDVKHHPYWEKDALLKEVKQRNAAPFGGWKDEPLTDAAPELLAASVALMDVLRDQPKGPQHEAMVRLADAITKATTTTTK